MREETREKRHAAISEAAYQLVSEKGFTGTSMLAIAKRAKASNETMYRWYGDKIGLFRALITDNAQIAKSVLEQSVEQDLAPMDTLAKLAPVLLEMLVGDRAIALNRAAAADPSGVLGRALSEAGRESVAPLIGAVVVQAADRGELSMSTPPEVVGLFLDLLVGDLQIRRAIGVIPALTFDQCQDRADLALTRFRALLVG